MIRKDFIKTLGAGSLLISVPSISLMKQHMFKISETENYFEDELKDDSLIVGPGGGETLELPGSSISFKVTSDISNNQLGVYEITLQPHTVGAKLHYHRFMDETFTVLKGELTIDHGTTREVAEPGTVVFVPRFTPHGFRNESDEEVKLLLIFNPSEKREGFFRGLHETLSEVPIDSSKFLKLYNKYDSFPVDREDMIPGADD